LVKNDDLFVNGLPWCFCVWIVYPRTNAQPPTKITVFDKITLFVNDMIYRWGWAFTHKIRKSAWNI